mmetsp:Transcript_3205/g.5633  ORF Transcript_3205/g.5633 Transcript_3205/m.5633 type:complete len:222 (-) Transcript_3205:430-1095(-)
MVDSTTFKLLCALFSILGFALLTLGSRVLYLALFCLPFGGVGAGVYELIETYVSSDSSTITYIWISVASLISAGLAAFLAVRFLFGFVTFILGVVLGAVVFTLIIGFFPNLASYPILNGSFLTLSCVCLGLLTWKKQNWFVLPGTALVGSFLCIYGFANLAGFSFNVETLYGGINTNKVQFNSPFFCTTIIVLAVLGVLCQLRFMTKSPPKSTETEPLLNE